MAATRLPSPFQRIVGVSWGASTLQLTAGHFQHISYVVTGYTFIGGQGTIGSVEGGLRGFTVVQFDTIQLFPIGDTYLELNTAGDSRASFSGKSLVIRLGGSAISIPIDSAEVVVFDGAQTSYSWSEPGFAFIPGQTYDAAVI